MKDYATGGEVKSADEILPGQGAVLRRGIAKIAAFRDDDGALHECSAACPHLGCIVSFDAVAKTWNCPCHGSQFDCYGRVIVGPANRDLSLVAPPETDDAADDSVSSQQLGGVNLEQAAQAQKASRKRHERKAERDAD